MVITCTISMFICNTATCAMMCPILKVRSTLLWSSSTRLPGGAGAGVLEGLEAKRGLRQWRGMLWWQGPHSQAEVRASQAGQGKGVKFWYTWHLFTCCIFWFEIQGYVLPGGGLCGQYWRHRNTHSFWAQRYIEGGIHDRRHIEGGTLSNL